MVAGAVAAYVLLRRQGALKALASNQYQCEKLAGGNWVVTYCISPPCGGPECL